MSTTTTSTFGIFPTSQGASTTGTGTGTGFTTGAVVSTGTNIAAKEHPVIWIVGGRGHDRLNWNSLTLT